MTELDVLLEDLTSGDDLQAEFAAERLPDFGSPALLALQLLLQDQNPDVRWWAVRSLAGFEKSGDTVSSLLPSLGDESREVRQAATLAFCQRPDTQAQAGLIRNLADPDPMVSRLASNALIALGSRAIPALVEVLERGIQSARIESARALAEIKDTRAIPDLMKAMEDDSTLVQFWAKFGLDNLGVGMVYFNPG